MKKIITLTLLLCSSSNIILATDTYTISNNTRTIPVSYEIAINNLQTQISYYEVMRSRLTYNGHLKATGIALAFLALAFVPISDSIISQEISKAVRCTFGCLAIFIQTMVFLSACSHIAINSQVRLLRQQIDRLLSESQYELNNTQQTTI